MFQLVKFNMDTGAREVVDTFQKRDLALQAMRDLPARQRGSPTIHGIKEV